MRHSLGNLHPLKTIGKPALGHLETIEDHTEQVSSVVDSGWDGAHRFAITPRSRTRAAPPVNDPTRRPEQRPCLDRRTMTAAVRPYRLRLLIGRRGISFTMNGWVLPARCAPFGTTRNLLGLAKGAVMPLYNLPVEIM
jgi:hypothetical protein